MLDKLQDHGSLDIPFWEDVAHRKIWHLVIYLVRLKLPVGARHSWGSAFVIQ